MEAYSEEDLRKLIASFREGLELYNKTLSESLEDLRNEPLENPHRELSKLAQLLYAHATKIGIAFRPPVSINASYEQLRETSSKLLLIVGLVAQFEPRAWSQLYHDEVVSQVREVISAFITLLDELEQLDFKDDSSENSEGRLISVGKVWDSCKSLEELMSLGNIGLLSKQIKLSIGIVEDASSELSEWLLDPYVETDILIGQDKEGEDDDDDDEVSHDTLEFANQWITKVKMLKLLLSSLAKSLPTKVADGSLLDQFNKEQKSLSANVDDLVCDIFLNQDKEQLDQNAQRVQDQSKLLIKLVRDLNKGDDKKTMWLDLWLEKFQH